ncbi:serine/threonine-protein kinase [Streptomyces sp. NPDC004232]|uniref:serine/threonine-protein kinase n=1 Tax=Streptomyces sp. NPDC004232 TaxID=3154454 RepID=UPI0033A849AC
MTLRDQLLGGRYQLVRQLGEGGMGQVWEAQDKTLRRPVAVKVISLLAGGGSRGDGVRARFLREAQITAQLQHPNIVTIHDLGETDTRDTRVPFLVMELVRGEGLDAMLRRGVVTLPDAARWGAQICDALADAHSAGIMHRDIKPSNIVITPSSNVKVLDFGIARAADPYATADRLTQTGFIVGTPPYMAPEQARGFPEPRSDLYALGCLLFELITGRLPFQAPDSVGYLSAHLTQEPPTPSSVSTDIPPAWDALVLRLLHKDPALRYPNAADLAQALRQLDHAPGHTPDGKLRPEPNLLAVDTAEELTLAHNVHAAQQAPPPREPDDPMFQPPPAPAGEQTAEAPQPTAPARPFTIAWTGKEPLSTYITATRSWGAELWARVSAVVLAVALLSVVILAIPATLGMIKGGVFRWFEISAVIGPLALLYLLASDSLWTLRHLHPTRGWSLCIGPQGIVTTSAFGEREYRWNQVKTVTVKPIGESGGSSRFNGLHVRFTTDSKRPTRERLAGWPRYLSKPNATFSGMVPICVLGPMTNQQRTELKEALGRHGGPARRPLATQAMQAAMTKLEPSARRWITKIIHRPGESTTKDDHGE